MLHYNFPPDPVGETGRMGSPGRREIGHGKLAWRAIRPMLPAAARIPVHDPHRVGDHRIERLVLDGDGLRLVAGADGCRRAAEGARSRASPWASSSRASASPVLSDILGDEDHLGDMDFKVAGTADGVTALQMDIKIAGITEEIMKVALDQAKGGRLHILGEMAQGARPRARPELGEYAPRIETIKIPTDKIREVIGSGGKVIREIVEKTGAKIDIQDDGTGQGRRRPIGKSITAAINWIKSIASEPEVGADLRRARS